jgi:hypothetical protein
MHGSSRRRVVKYNRKTTPAPSCGAVGMQLPQGLEVRERRQDPKIEKAKARRNSRPGTNHEFQFRE